MEKNPLLQFGNIPITTDILYGCFNRLSSPDDKILALEKGGELIRLRRGLYVVNQELSGKPYAKGLYANHIYGPSYVSLQWATHWYGLIPEMVTMVTSVTTQRSRHYDSPIGRYAYYHMQEGYYNIGIRMVKDEKNGVTMLMATPEKALCDTIMHDRYIPGQSVKALWQYLEEDIRFDTDALRDFDINIIEQCAQYQRKTNILQNLIKIIKKL